MIKKAKAKAKTKTAATSAPEKKAPAKSTWAETMKKSLENKATVTTGPKQPKPRDSGKFRVKKDAF